MWHNPRMGRPSTSQGFSERLQLLEQVVEEATDIPLDGRQGFFESDLKDEPELLFQASRLLHLHTTDMLSTDPAVRSAAVRESLQQEPLKVSGDRLGPYRVVNVLGEGGMGRVDLAERDVRYPEMRNWRPYSGDRHLRGSFGLAAGKVLWGSAGAVTPLDLCAFGSPAPAGICHSRRARAATLPP